VPEIKRQLQEKPAYDDDFAAWLLDQANQLRVRKPKFIDWEQVAEELEEMSVRLRHALSSDLEIVLQHLLKLQYEPSPNEWRGRSRGWKLHATEHRNRVNDILEDSKTLRNNFADFLAKAYPRARQEAAIETGCLETHYPSECPWSTAQILDTTYFPEPFSSTNGQTN
jgi:hypothetical protein